MQIAMFLLGFILFVSLVLVHEWGHYFAARRNGVDVEEFGLGFPPRAWGKKRKDGMILSLNWLPLGGFVKLKGEHDSDTAKGSYGAASTKAKTKIMLAGVAMNLLVGWAILTVLAAVGMPKLIDNQFAVAGDIKTSRAEVLVGYIQPGSPAEKAGLTSHDQVLSVTGGQQTYDVSNVQQLHDATLALAGQNVQVSIKHSGQTVTKNVTLRTKKEVNASQNSSDPKGYLGVEPTALEMRRSTWSAPVVAIGFTAQLTKLTFVGLGHAVSGLASTIAGGITNNHQARTNGQTQATAQVGGPVAIMSILWNGGTLGINFVLMVIAVISLTLAIMNVLPIPALDGGRLFLLWASRIMRKPLSQHAEELINGIGMAVLLTLFALITIVDVKRFL